MTLKKKKNANVYMDEPETLDLFGSLTPQEEVVTPIETVSVIEEQIQDVTESVEDKIEIQSREESQKTSHFETEEDVKVTALRAPRVVKKEPKSSRRKGRKKTGGAFKTISELASYLSIPQHVLRFWETKFTQIKPMKRGGGRRYYRPEDVTLVERIHHLLYNEGYTIKGVQRLIKISSKQAFLSGEQAQAESVQAQEPQKTKKSEATSDAQSPDQTSQAITTLLQGLRDIKKELSTG